MIYLTKAVFINSCQTFIFFPSSLAYWIDQRWCCLSCLVCREETRGRFGYLHTILARLPRTPTPQHLTFLKWKINKQKPKCESLTSLDASAWCMANTERLVWPSHWNDWKYLPFLLQNGFDVANNEHETEAKMKGRREGPRGSAVLGPLVLLYHLCPAAGGVGPRVTCEGMRVKSQRANAHHGARPFGD